MKHKQILVLALNRRHATYYATSAGLRPMEWFYVFDEHSLMGGKGFDVVVYETFWQRRWSQLYPLMERLRMIQEFGEVNVHYAAAYESAPKVRTTPPLLV